MVKKYKREAENAAAAYHGRMAKIFCDGAGVPDHGGPWRATAQEPATEQGACPRCAGSQSAYLFGIRIDDAENIGADRRDPRTRGVNLGLPGVAETIGHRKDGKPITRYRPIASAELSSNRKLRDYAKAHGLTPADEGRYRSR